MFRRGVRKAAVPGAVWGVAIWSAYAVIELLLTGVWELCTKDQAIFSGKTWEITGSLFNIYWALGAASGALCSAVAACFYRTWPLIGSRIPASLGLCIALALNAAIAPKVPLASKFVIAIAGLLACLMLAALLRPKSALPEWAEIHPVLLSALLLGPPWVSTELMGSSGILLKRIAAGGLFAALLGIIVLIRRRPSWGASRHASASLAMLALAVTGAAMISGGNRYPFVSNAPSVPDPKAIPVILITWDTTRADHLSVYGYPERTTPNLEQFTRGATLYTDATAAADWTLPSHGSIFTGVYPSWHRAHAYSAHPAVIRPLDTKIPTLAGILSNKGYFAAGIAANSAFLVPEWGLSRGFNGFDVETPVATLQAERPFLMRNGIRALLNCWFDTADFDSLYRQAHEVNRNTFRLLQDEAARNRSFFLFLNYMDAHSPYVSPAGRRRTLSLSDEAGLEETLYRKHLHISPAARDELIWRYDAGIRAEDAAFAELIDWLKASNLYDQALIILTSDHGEAFGENGRLFHGVGVAPDQVQVPLIIKYPHQTKAEVVRTPVSHVDLMPTVLDTLGYPIPAHVQGRSLRNPEGLDQRPIFVESYLNPLVADYDSTLDRTERAMRVGVLKAVISSKGKSQLFDLSTDPREERDVRATHPAAPQLEAAFREWIRGVPQQVAPARNDQEMQRLRGLGYVR